MTGSAPALERGLALMFTLAGLVGIGITLLAWGSRSYRNLSHELEGPAVPVPTTTSG